VNAEVVDWTLPLSILAVGLALGALFVWMARRGKTAAALQSGTPNVARRDLTGRRDALVAQLRELEATSDKLSAEQFQTQQSALELELAQVLKAIDDDDRTAGRGRSKKLDAAASTAGISPTFKGFLWGVTSTLAVGGLFVWVAQVAQPRREGGSVTGEVPMSGAAPMRGAPSSAPPTGPTSPEEQELQAAVDKNPDDFDARIGLAQLALGRNDMMVVWNQTQYVLERQPGEPHALTYQALVRVAMGQPEMAVTMLQQALKAQPDLVDAYLHLALAYLRLGRAKDAEQIVATARQRFPQDAPALAKVFAQMRTRVTKEPGPTEKAATEGLPTGPDNPHNKADGALATAEMPPPAAPATTTDGKAGQHVSGTIELGPAVQGQVAGRGVLFVLARAAGVTAGPPVAVKRLTPAAFPVAFDLGDGDSMTGQPLPARLRIEARLDADGDAATRDPNDPKGALDNIAGGTAGLKLVLSR
jgi:tetratricopeptide (TPR) repeat protein